MTYITVNEAESKWNIGARRICILCKQGRIPGALKMSGVWMIPQNAEKPEDRRKQVTKTGILPIVLLYNPTFFSSRNITPTSEEANICLIQEAFLNGRFSEAYDDLNKALFSCKDNHRKYVLLLLQSLLDADCGKKDDFLKTIDELKQLILSDETLQFERFLQLYHLGYIDYFDRSCIDDTLFEEVEPIVSLIFMKRSINDLLHNCARSDISLLEVVCYELEKKDCHLISAYCHLYLAVYFNIIGVKQLFELHFNKALDILIPRGWYTPIAEYSATIDLKSALSSDPRSYQIISKLSGQIIKSFSDVGIFNDVPSPSKMLLDTSFQIGYKIVQGKNIETIAEEMGMSQYKVRQLIADLYSITGVNSKKELKSFILKNITI